jgi:hypothetical protein
MKSFAAVAAATVIAYAVFVAAEECDYSVVGPSLHTLADPITDCMSSTGYNIANYTATATEEQKEAVCSDCTSLIDALNDLTWPDCTMDLGGVNQTLSAYFAGIIGDCSTAGSQYTSALATTTTTDSSASTAGESATVGSSAGSSTDATVETPAPSTSSSSGSTTDGAVTVTVSAVVLVASAIAAAAL